MTSFLFWNIMNKDLRGLVANAVVEHDVDILLLAESGIADADMTTALEEATGKEYAAFSEPADKVRLFSRLTNANWTLRQADYENARMAVWSANIGKPPGILLVAAHFVSKNNESSGGQALLAAELSKEISRVEDFARHQRTLVVGDLNMNPFEDGLTGAPALHAVMTRNLAREKERIVQGRPYRFFYNPMWGHFGDRTAGPPGTYYHRAATAAELFWHMFDQVLLRPDLMESLTDLKILDRIGEHSLLTKLTGKPNKTLASDHLPLMFRLNLE